ncbi:hypothetical protein HYX00_03685, partial [Candidatus Woesearchaeota archaeon]|nr:hypothetical protein [Candidatus Woesearchaeota archaeon]
NLKFNQNEIDSVKNEVYSFRDKIIEYGQNRIIPDIQIIEIDNGEGVELSQYGSGFWQWSANVYSAIKPYYSLDTDFMFVVSNIKDANKKVYFDAPICDGSIANTFNYGIGFTWIPIGKDSIGCANSLTFVHGFLHQLANAINKINLPDNFKPYETNNYEYSGQKLSCSTKFNSRYSYFPDADVAPLDPDFDSCKGNFGDNWIEGYCADLVRKGFDKEECNIRYDKHVLGDHFPLNYIVIGNSCINGKQDFDETGVDIGGQCSIYGIQGTPSKQPITPSQPKKTMPTTVSTTPLISETPYQNCFQFDSTNNNLGDSARINLVLIGLRYGSLDDFKHVVELAMDTKSQNDGLFSVEPFKSNRDKFNILFSNKIIDESFERIPYDERGLQYVGLAREASNDCPYNNKRIIVLGNVLFLPRAYPNDIAINSFIYPADVTDYAEYIKGALGTFLHETGGHAIGGLYDEYLWQNWLPEPDVMEGSPWVNQCFYVSPSELSCKFEYGSYKCDDPNQAVIDKCNQEAPWHDIIGNGCGSDGITDCNSDNPDSLQEVGCYFAGSRFSSGCAPNSFISTRATLMTSETSSRKSLFGQNNERLICRKIRELTGSAGGICNKLCVDSCAIGQKCISGVCQTFK